MNSLFKKITFQKNHFPTNMRITRPHDPSREFSMLAWLAGGFYIIFYVKLDMLF